MPANCAIVGINVYIGARGGKHNCWVETILVALHLEVQYCAVQQCFDASIFSGCSLLAAKVSVGVVLLSSDLVVISVRSSWYKFSMVSSME